MSKNHAEVQEAGMLVASAVVTMQPALVKVNGIVQGCAGCHVVPHQLMPNGSGGLVIVAYWNTSPNGPFESRLVQLAADGQRTETTIALDNGRVELIGQGGTAYLRIAVGSNISQPVIDLSTSAVRWHLPVEWRFLAATPDGGAVAQNAAGDLGRFDGTGQLLGTIPSLNLRNPVQALGGLTGNNAYGLSNAAGTFDDATYWNATDAKLLWNSPERYGQGNPQKNLAPPQVCGLCFNGYVPPDGKGPIAPPMDRRRIVTIAIDELVGYIRSLQPADCRCGHLRREEMERRD